MDMTLKTQNVSFTVTRFSWERIYLFFDIQVNPACSPDSSPLSMQWMLQEKPLPPVKWFPVQKTRFAFG